MMFRLLRTAVAVAILTTFSTSSANTIGNSQATAPHVNTSTPKEDNELCNNATLDAMFNSPHRVINVFKGDKYWELTDDDKVAPGYPRLIGKSWIGLPNNIDAAYTDNNGKTYFFKGSQVWRYTDKVMDGDYPKLISESFPGIPDNVDLAFTWHENREIYFFKGHQYWEFSPRSNPPVNRAYPKLISNWEGLPNNLNAALKHTEEHTYFFKNGMYYRFNDQKFAVDRLNPRFPRPAGPWWFGCPNENSSTVV